MITEREIIEVIMFGASIENVNLAEELVDRVCMSQNIDEDAYGNVLIALTEAVNNAILHGSLSDPSKEVKIEVLNKTNQIEFVVTDEGNGFDFNNLEDPTDPKNIEKPHGRGIFLMKNLADEVEYEGKGNIVHLYFNLN